MPGRRRDLVGGRGMPPFAAVGVAVASDQHPPVPRQQVGPPSRRRVPVGRRVHLAEVRPGVRGLDLALVGHDQLGEQRRHGDGLERQALAGRPPVGLAGVGMRARGQDRVAVTGMQQVDAAAPATAVHLVAQPPGLGPGVELVDRDPAIGPQEPGVTPAVAPPGQVRARGERLDLGPERLPGLLAAVARIDVPQQVPFRDQVPDQRVGPALPPGFDLARIDAGAVLRHERTLGVGVDREDLQAEPGVADGVLAQSRHDASPSPETTQAARSPSAATTG